MTEIILLHMVDGKTVIGRVKYESSDLLILERACEIVIVPPQKDSLDKKPQLFYVPYLTMMGALPGLEEVELRPAHILYKRASVPKPLEDGYIEVTSGIHIAQSV